MIGQLENPMEVDGGVLDLPFLEQADPAIEVHLGIGGADVQRLTEILECSVEVAGLDADLARWM